VTRQIDRIIGELEQLKREIHGGPGGRGFTPPRGPGFGGPGGPRGGPPFRGSSGSSGPRGGSSADR
jgi:hypothetical protein